jgi:hypothetical protein
MIRAVGLVAVLSLAVPARAQESAPVPAVPVDAIAAIVDAFRTHRVVALSDAHGNEQAQAFLIQLVRDSRFAAAVDDVVVEFGSARYQDTIDRFVQGEDVPYDDLRRVWQDTTQPSAAGDVPINEMFFRAVRDVNASRELCEDRAYRDMRAARLAIAGAPPAEAEAFDRHCSALLGR